MTTNYPPEIKIKDLLTINQTFYSVDPFSTPVDYHIGMEYSKLNNYSEALPYLENAYTINSTQLATLNNLAVAHEMTGNRDRAFELNKKICALYPRHYQAFLNCALICYQQGSFSESREYFNRIKKKGIKKNPSLYQRYMMLSDSLELH